MARRDVPPIEIMRRTGSTGPEPTSSSGKRVRPKALDGPWTDWVTRPIGLTLPLWAVVLVAFVVVLMMWGIYSAGVSSGESDAEEVAAAEREEQLEGVKKQIAARTDPRMAGLNYLRLPRTDPDVTLSLQAFYQQQGVETWAEKGDDAWSVIWITEKGLSRAEVRDPQLRDQIRNQMLSIALLWQRANRIPEQKFPFNTMYWDKYDVPAPGPPGS